MKFNEDLLVGGISIVLGALALLAAIFNWDASFQLLKIRWLESRWGRSTVRVIYALLGIGLMFHRHKTSIEPWKPTSTVMAHGPYAYSRNPIYVGFCFVVIGVGLSQNSLWITLSFLPAGNSR